MLRLRKRNISPVTVVTPKYSRGWIFLDIYLPLYNNMYSHMELIQESVNTTDITKYPQETVE